MGADARAPDLLGDLALLSSVAATVHFFWGVWGLLAALGLAAAAEHGPAALEELRARWRKAGQQPQAPVTQGHADDEEGREQLVPTHGSDAPGASMPSETADGRRRAGSSMDAREAAEPDAGLSRLRIRDVGSLHASTAAPGAASPVLPPFTPNSPAPIPFETDLFVGHVLFLVRTEAPLNAPYAEVFRGKRRMFWIQVQGRFKREPRGAVYLGGELPSRIAPGFFTRSLVVVIVGLIRQLLPVGDLHFSFGDDSSSDGTSSRHHNRELPAISFPLYQSVDQFIETPEGQDPPQLGSIDFGEPVEMRDRRRQTPLGAEKYIVGATYSFHFHTMYVDLTKWETVNLPGLSSMDLSAFFDTLPLRLAAYDVIKTPGSSRHAQSNKDYLFSFEIQYDRHHHSHDRSAHSQVHDGDVLATVSSTSSSSARESRAQSIGVNPIGSDLSTRSSTNVSDELTSEIDDDNLSSSMSTVTAEMDAAVKQQHRRFLARENASRLARLAPSFLCWMEELDVDSGLRFIYYVFSVNDLSATYEDEETEVVDQVEAEPGNAGYPQSEPTRRRRCLSIVSAHTLRSVFFGRDGMKIARRGINGGAIKFEEKSSKLGAELKTLRFHTRSRIGSYSTITDETLDVVHRLQTLVLGYGGDHDSSNSARGDLTLPDTGQDDEDEELMAARSALYQALLRRQWLQSPETTAASMSPSRLGVNLSRREREELGVVFEGVVYRYYTDGLLRQEVLQLTTDALLFYRSYSSRPEKNVDSDSVIGVRAISVPLLSLSGGNITEGGAFALEVSTLGEQIVLCLGTAFARDAWVRVIEQHCDPRANATKWLAPSAFSSKTPRQLQAQIEHQVRACTTSIGAKLQPADRVVLNSWSLFTAPLNLSAPSDNEEAEHAIELVAHTLRQALLIHAAQKQITDTANAPAMSMKQVLAFLERASALRAVDLQLIQDACSHEQQLAFYLNLYHLILAHAMMAHGFPSGRRGWDKFLRSMSYSFARRRPRNREMDVNEGYSQVTVSLAELEHLLLRARMPRADIPHLRLNAMARALSATRLAGLGLRHPDFRLSLALAINQYAECNVRVFLAGPEVHSQLNVMASSLLQSPSGKMEVRAAASVVRLPRVFEWYRRDFGRSPLNALRKLLGFLEAGQQQQVLRLLESEQPVHIEYRTFKYSPKDALLLFEDEKSDGGALCVERSSPRGGDDDDGEGKSETQDGPSQPDEDQEYDDADDENDHEQYDGETT